MRLCDRCGTQMPRFQARTALAGGLVCEGCVKTANLPESPTHLVPSDNGYSVWCNICRRPVGGTGGSLAAASHWADNHDRTAHGLANLPGRGASVNGSKADPEPYVDYCPHCGCFREDDVRDCPGFSGDPNREPCVCHLGGIYEDDDDEPAPPFKQWYPGHAAKAASRKVAHDSGDGETVYHCPFCGGGQVVGGSDGSVECGFCKTLFTVQVQPEHAAMPQTINGVPQQMPGMPGQVGGDPAAPPGGVPPVPGASPVTDTGTDAFIPPDAFAPPPKTAEPAPPVVAKLDRLYINANGVALPEESYMRHLAIAFADDPTAVIAQVREERTSE